MLTLFGAVANVSKQPSAFFLSVDISSVRRGGGKIPRCIEFSIDWENVNVNALLFVGRLLCKVGKFLQDYTVSDTTRQFSRC
jgi:hypothetical protein